MFRWFDYNTDWFHWTASGLVDAVWAEVWHWGLGIGLIIIFIAATFLSPIGKQFFAAAAGFVFILLVVYGISEKAADAVCEARIKAIYLELHPEITPKTITKKPWKVSPTWPKKPVVKKPVAPACDGPFDTGCW